MKKFWILAIALTFLSVPVLAAPPSHGGHHGGGAGIHGAVSTHRGAPGGIRPAGRPSVGHPPVAHGHIGRPPMGRPPMPPRYVHHRPHPIIITGGFYRPYYRPYYYYSTYYTSPYYYPPVYEDPYYYDGINTTANVINAAAAAATAVRLWTW